MKRRLFNMSKEEFLDKLKRLGKRRKLVYKNAEVVDNAKNVTDAYMEYLVSLENSTLSDLKAYKLLNGSPQAVTELYRISLYRVFNKKCEFAYEFESLQVFVPSCMEAIRDAVFSVEYKNDSDKFFMIQGCLTIVGILERKVGDYLYAN